MIVAWTTVTSRRSIPLAARCSLIDTRIVSVSFFFAFQGPAKLQERGRIQRALPAEICAHETANRLAVVQRGHHCLVRQPAALLRDVHAKHPLQPDRQTT